jgi:hypothetical protein
MADKIAQSFCRSSYDWHAVERHIDDSGSGHVGQQNMGVIGRDAGQLRALEWGDYRLGIASGNGHLGDAGMNRVRFFKKQA